MKINVSALQLEYRFQVIDDYFSKTFWNNYLRHVIETRGTGSDLEDYHVRSIRFLSISRGTFRNARKHYTNIACWLNGVELHRGLNYALNRGEVSHSHGNCRWCQLDKQIFVSSGNCAVVLPVTSDSAYSYPENSATNKWMWLFLVHSRRRQEEAVSYLFSAGLERCSRFPRYD